MIKINDEKPDRLNRILTYAARGLIGATAISAMRVTGDKQVSERNKIALGCLYREFRNAGRQWERRKFNDLYDILGLNYFLNPAEDFMTLTSYLEARLT